MAKVKPGDTVKIHYVAKLKDGTVFDSTPQGETFQITLGKPENLEELDKALVGMEAGESKTLLLPAEKGFGDYDENLIVALPRDTIPNDFEIKIGEYIVFETDEDDVKEAKLEKMDDSFFYFDCNHPLAGKDLQYEIELISIE